jgi:hypothetical protein
MDSGPLGRVAERLVAVPPVRRASCFKTSVKKFARVPSPGEECGRLSKTALNPSAIKDYLDMEQRWLNLAHSYEFAERLPNFTTTAFGRRELHKK